jgi:hypothetical protein
LTPEYLKWNNKKTYDSSAFCYYHQLFRLKPEGNLIEIPMVTLMPFPVIGQSSLKNKDILHHFPPNPKNVDYSFAFTKEFKLYLKECTVSENHNVKVHKITCELKHEPILKTTLIQ